MQARRQQFHVIDVEIHDWIGSFVEVVQATVLDLEMRDIDWKNVLDHALPAAVSLELALRRRGPFHEI